MSRRYRHSSLLCKSAYDEQQGELAQLRALVERTKAVQSTLKRHVATQQLCFHMRSIVSPPRVVRPMDYWERHVPDYGDATTATDLAAIRARPRVRPEDVVLTDEERARLERRRPSASVPPWLFWRLVCDLGGVILCDCVYYVGR